MDIEEQLIFFNQHKSLYTSEEQKILKKQLELDSTEYTRSLIIEAMRENGTLKYYLGDLQSKINRGIELNELEKKTYLEEKHRQ